MVVVVVDDDVCPAVGGAGVAVIGAFGGNALSVVRLIAFFALFGGDFVAAVVFARALLALMAATTAGVTFFFGTSFVGVRRAAGDSFFIVCTTFAFNTLARADEAFAARPPPAAVDTPAPPDVVDAADEDTVDGLAADELLLLSIAEDDCPFLVVRISD